MPEPPSEPVAIAAGAIDFDETLASGQTFAFNAESGGYVGIVDGRPVRISGCSDSVAENTVHCRGEDEAFWRHYFSLDGDYSELLAPYLASDPILAACVRAFAGIRILRQPVWEALCAFIISANNNQRRIENIYRGMAARWGDAVLWEGRTFHGFPSPQKLASVGEEALRELGAGYRAPYLATTAAMVADGFLLDLDGMDYAAALAHLVKLPGVGEKVADCVLLFASGHTCAFPVDVWIERVLENHYGLKGTRAAMKKAAQVRFGVHAGILQQYLFHGARSGII
jgi:N-glycosylase/DNA lyase